MATKSATTKSKITCCSCGKELAQSRFNTSYSDLYSANGRLPICATCLDRQFEIYKNKYGETIKAVQRTCMAFDLYYSEEVLASAMKVQKADFFFSDYYRRLSLSGLNKEKTFDDSLLEGFVFGGDFLNGEETQVPIALIKKWGKNYRPEEYNQLEEHYEILTKDNPDRTNQQEIFIKELCDIDLMKCQAKMEGRVKEYGELCKLYRDTFAQADLSVTNSINSSDMDTMGTFINLVQKFTPAEYYKDQDLYKDVDNINDYWQRFVVRPLRNLMTGSKDRDEEFYIPEDET